MRKLSLVTVAWLILAGMAVPTAPHQSTLQLDTLDDVAADDRISLFIPTFERDLCSLLFNARSVATFDPDAKVIRDVHIAWVTDLPIADYAIRIGEITGEYTRAPGRTVTFSTPYTSTSTNGKGWFKQQAAKLEASKAVRTEVST